MKVLINGLGNIGTSLAQLLVKYQSDFGITKIYAHKRTQNQWNESELDIIKCTGIEVIRTTELDKIFDQLHYVFETTSNGVGLQNHKKYLSATNLIGACAQGSEKGFGTPFISGVNDTLIEGKKMVQVVSCNTHGTSALLQFFGGDSLQNIISADAVVVRRSEDIGNHERLVAGNVIARHLDPNIGTHHAIDVVDLYKTLNIQCNLTSSDITTPSQFLHTVRFNFELENLIDIEAQLSKSTFIGTTNKFDSNVVFELGRRYGFAGRLFNHAILVKSNMMITRNSIKGWAFVPQEGNTLISTLHAFLLQTKHPKQGELIQKVKSDLILKSF